MTELYRTPTQEDAGRTIRVRQRKEHDWVERKLFVVLPETQAYPFVCEAQPDTKLSTSWRFAQIQKSYKELQAESEFKVGDRVIVHRAFTSGEQGFDRAFSWDKDMSFMIGKVNKISDIEKDGIVINGFVFPYFVLQKAPEVKYVPFAWEDRHLLYDRRVIVKWENGAEQDLCMDAFTKTKEGNFNANGIHIERLLAIGVFADTDEPVGKKVT